MDPKLSNYINMDLKWNIVKRDNRRMTRRPRKLGTASFELGVKRPEPSGFEFQKFGTDVLGQHLGEKVLDAPLKKIRLLHQSPSPPSPAPCLDVEGGVSRGPQTPVVHHEDLGQRCCLNSLSQSEKTKSKIGLRNSNIIKMTKKDVCNLDDFSGIELLAAAACSSFIGDDMDHGEDFLVLKEHTTPGGHLCTVEAKEAIIPTESNGSSIQDSIVSDTHDNGRELGEKKVASSKELRLHWDLNTVMDEWEEPCNDFLVEPQIHEKCLEGVYNGGSKSGKMNLEGYESRCAEVVVAEERSMLDGGAYVNQFSVKHDAGISVGPLNENCNVDSFGKTYGELTCSQEVMGTKMITSNTSNGESSATKSDVVDSMIHPGMCEEFSTSTTSVLREQIVVKGESDTTEYHLVQSMPKNTISKSDRQPIFEEAMQGECQSLKLCKSYCDNKITSEDPVSECCASNVTQDEPGQMAEGDTMDKVQVGYDSPFEDGELREPIEWEENEVEEKEILCYESDNIDKDEFGTIEIHSGKFETSPDHVETMEDQSFLLVKEAVPNNDIEEGAQADTCNEVSGCQLELVESDCGTGRDFSERKNGYGESILHGGNSVHIDESPSFDVCGNGAYVWQSRSVGRDKVSFQDGRCNDTRGSCVDSSIRVWDLKSSHNYQRPKNVTGDPFVRSVGCRILDSNQSRNYNPRGVYRTQNRMPSPSGRTNSYGMHPGPPVRSLSRDRYRVGSGFCPQGMRRAPEEEYHDSKPSYLGRKAGCFSPNFSRPWRRSRSRSRSGSPIAWHFQKRRNSDARQSPDHEARFKGKRVPFQKPSNCGEMEAGFVSLSRGHTSPERSSKCFDDRKFVDGQFRDKRQSLVAMTRPNQRCEPFGYPDRFKSNDHFRFTQRLGRFSQMTGPGTGREHKYHNGDVSRKHDGHYEKANRVGRSDDVGGVRRFRYMMDESFETRNHRNLDGYSRDFRNEHSCTKDADTPESKR